MKNHLKQDQFTVIERHGQLVIALNEEYLLPENAPVRLTSAQLEELDYRKLYRAYSPCGRKSKVDPRVMFKVMVYGYQCGIYSSRKLEEACEYRIDFKWLLEGQKAPDHATFARFRTGRCVEAVEDLFYQYVQLLEKQGETDHETVFVDGTKLESSAGRYTFCWRGSVEKHLSKVREKVFQMTGSKNRQALQEYLEQQRERVEFVRGKGNHKSEEQRRWEELDALYTAVQLVPILSMSIPFNRLMSLSSLFTSADNAFFCSCRERSMDSCPNCVCPNSTGGASLSGSFVNSSLFPKA